MTGNFKDLQFRGTRWYLASEVDQKLMELTEKAEKWEKLQNSELLHDIIVNASKLEAVKNWYIEYAGTKIGHSDYPWLELDKILEAEGS